MCLNNTKEARFVVANTSLDIDKTIKSAASFDLELIERFDCCGIFGKPPLFSIFIFGIKAFHEKNEPKLTRIYIRDSNGQYTSEYAEILTLLGKPIPSFEPGSVPKQ